jgi:hypothetical protein
VIAARSGRKAAKLQSTIFPASMSFKHCVSMLSYRPALLPAAAELEPVLEVFRSAAAASLQGARERIRQTKPRTGI